MEELSNIYILLVILIFICFAIFAIVAIAVIIIDEGRKKKQRYVFQAKKKPVIYDISLLDSDESIDETKISKESLDDLFFWILLT